MIHIEYECDRCGHKQPTIDQMWDVGWGFCSSSGSLFSQHSYAKTVPVIRGMWCRKCLEKWNFLPTEKPVPATLPTLEDMLREMVREEIEASK
jgi:hypothetical protein